MAQDRKGTKKHLSITVYYLLASILFSLPAFWQTGILLTNWNAMGFADASTLYVVHALILGLMLTTSFGVLYQFIPIAFQAAPIPRQTMYWQLPLHLLSVGVMLIGFRTFHMLLVGMGGGLLLINSLVFGWLLWRSYRKAKNRTFVYRGLSIPFLLLYVVMVLGLWMAFGLPGMSVKLFVAHILLGIFGFWIGMVLVISYKFVPMFTLSHGYRTTPMLTYRMYMIGVGIILLGDMVPEPLSEWLISIGCITGLIAIWLFSKDMRNIVQSRKRKQIVMPIRYALVSLGCVLISSVLLFIGLIFKSSDLLMFAGYFLLYAGFIPLIFSYMQKIVPFLWYEYRFSHRPERKQAPLIDDMVPIRRAQWAMNLYFFAVGCGLILLSWQPEIESSFLRQIISYALASLFTISPFLLFTALAQVLTIGGPRPRDD
jgi:hypothetical protein